MRRPGVCALALLAAAIIAPATGLSDAPTWFEDNARIGLSPGGPFGDDNCVRFNLACPRDTLAEALQRFERAVKSRLSELS